MSFGYVGAIVGGVLLSQMTQKPNIPTPAAPLAPPQASVAPNATDTLKSVTGTGQAGGAPGVAQTFLTGPGGVDQSTLLLGKSSLLGG